MSCEGHRARAINLILQAHPSNDFTAQKAEAIYQQARQSVAAVQTRLPKISEPFRRHRGRNAILTVEGALPPALQARLEQLGFSRQSTPKENTCELTIPVRQYRGAASDFIQAMRHAETLADLGLDPVAHATATPAPRAWRVREKREQQARVEARQRAGALDELQAALKKSTDVLKHTDLAALYGRLASGLMGRPCRVVMADTGSQKLSPHLLCRFRPDAGVFVVNPRPLSEEAPARHNLLLARIGIERELACQKHTPPEIVATAYAMAEGRLPDEGLDYPARQLVPAAYGLIERARAERVWLGHNAGLIKGAYAARELKPSLGGNLPGLKGDFGATPTAALEQAAVPFGGLTEKHWGWFPAPQRQVLKKLAPIVAQAARGAPEDVYRAALVVARELSAAGLTLDLEMCLPKPPETVKPLNLMRRCTHCQSFLSRDGQCPNPNCSGQKPNANERSPAADPDKPKATSAKKSPQPEENKTTDARAALIDELRQLEQKNAELTAQVRTLQQHGSPARAKST